MFRRLESGLPKDPEFPADLEALGYFVNNKDEIRSIENPKAYFKFFLSKNERHNIMQREAMNEVIRNIVSERLEKLGLQKIRLPLGAKENEPNLPIFISSNLASKKRVIILFYEHTQDIGIFAHRIIGGKGGINPGSVINFVKYIQSLSTSSSDSSAPGIILTNMGQLRWWRRGKKAITQTSWMAIPQKSAVEPQVRLDFGKNTIPGNRTTEEHCDYMFNVVVEQLCDPTAKFNVVGVSEGAMRVAGFLNMKANFQKWGGRVTAFAAVATYYHTSDINNKDFREWLAKRGRAYIPSLEPSGFLAGPEGNRNIPAHGCPAFSVGESYYSETMLPKGYKTVLDWFQEVAADANYQNPQFVRYEPEEEESDAEGMEIGGTAMKG